MRHKGRRYSTMEYGELWRMDYDIIFKENAPMIYSMDYEASWRKKQ